jgi:glucose dehydrogenase
VASITTVIFITGNNVPGEKSNSESYCIWCSSQRHNENLQATPLGEDGYLYVVDQWGVVYKIDGRSGDAGRIVWRMDPGQEKLPLSNRGAALWGNLVISSANYPPRIIATDKNNGKVVWETNLGDGQTDLQLTAAPLAVKDKIIVGAAGGDRGVRDFIAALDGTTASGHKRRCGCLRHPSICPLHSESERNAGWQRNDVTGPNRTHAAQQKRYLFDHLIGGLRTVRCSHADDTGRFQKIHCRRSPEVGGCPGGPPQGG